MGWTEHLIRMPEVRLAKLPEKGKVMSVLRWLEGNGGDLRVGTAQLEESPDPNPGVWVRSDGRVALRVGDDVPDVFSEEPIPLGHWFRVDPAGPYVYVREGHFNDATGRTEEVERPVVMVVESELPS